MEGVASVPAVRRRETGFSLLEVMVGVAVLIGGLMGLGMAMISAYRMDRMSTERKIALAFAASQIERVRGMPMKEVVVRPRYYNETVSSGGYLPETSWGTCATGLTAAVGTTAGAGTMGFRQDVDNDGDEDYFGIYYTRQTPQANGAYSEVYVLCGGGFWVRTSDSMLNALTPIPRSTLGGRMAQISFRDTDATTGLVEGSGYWVTVKVFWQGSSGGEQEVKLSTFVSR